MRSCTLCAWSWPEMNPCLRSLFMLAEQTLSRRGRFSMRPFTCRSSGCRRSPCAAHRRGCAGAPACPHLDRPRAGRSEAAERLHELGLARAEKTGHGKGLPGGEVEAHVVYDPMGRDAVRFQCDRAPAFPFRGGPREVLTAGHHVHDLVAGCLRGEPGPRRIARCAAP